MASLSPQHQNLVCPRPELLNLMRSVGAKGISSSKGELFTFKQLIGYLREYIKLRQLYDPMDPATVYCAADPLGQVLGVGQFTVYETLGLVHKNVESASMVRQRCCSPCKNRNGRQTSQVTETSKLQCSVSQTSVFATPCRQQDVESTGSPRQQRVDSPESFRQHHVESAGSLGQQHGDSSGSLRQQHVESAGSHTQQHVESVGSLGQQHVNSLGSLRQQHDESAGSHTQQHVESAEPLQYVEYTELPKQSLVESTELFKQLDSTKLHKPAETGEDQKESARKIWVSVSTSQPSTSREVSERPSNHVEAETNGRRKKKRKRTRCDSNSPSERALCRKRQSSLSILYSSDGEAGGASEPWCLTLELEETGGESEVLSVQSKETVLVQDSSDDLWFLDEDEQEAAVEHISVQLDSSDHIAIQLQAEDPYIEEYEVESSSSGSGEAYGNDVSVHSSVNEIIVMCGDSDVEFWADSESSDAESDASDDELQDGDKWQCDKCSTVNSPLCRYCDRCRKVRPGWLGADAAPTRMSPPVTPERPTPEGHSLESSPAPLGAYFNRESFRGRTSRTLTQLSSVTTLDKLGTMPVTEKVNLLLNKSTSSTSELAVDPLLDSPGCSTSQLGSPRTRRRHRVPAALRRWDSGLGTSQSSGFVSDLQAIKASKETVSKSTNHTASPCKSLASAAVTESGDTCLVCFSKAKEASIIHGNTGHQVCCYGCAKRLRRKGKPCPVCRRPIEKVVRNFIL